MISADCFVFPAPKFRSSRRAEVIVELIGRGGSCIFRRIVPKNIFIMNMNLMIISSNICKQQEHAFQLLFKLKIKLSVSHKNINILSIQAIITANISPVYFTMEESHLSNLSYFSTAMQKI